MGFKTMKYEIHILRREWHQLPRFYFDIRDARKDLPDALAMKGVKKARIVRVTREEMVVKENP